MTLKVFVVLSLALMVLYTRPIFMAGVEGSRPTLVVYGFSILEEVMSAGILPAFKEKWKGETGEEIHFYTSFAGSGTVMNQVRFGAPADIAILAHSLDVERLRQARLIRHDWTTSPHGGIINRTPIILIVRPGNPKGLHGFDDLRKPGVGIVHPDPQTSGGALWGLLAEYGAFALPEGGDREAAREGLTELWKNVIVLGASARAARTQFEMGFGDVLITYEQEAVKDLSRGKFKHEAVVPVRTIYSEHPAVVIDRNLTPEKERLIRAFLDFLWSEEAQRIFVKYGFRSITDDRLNEENRYFAKVASPFTVADLGGWKRAYSEIVQDLWQKQILEEAHR